jgi:hypothetical protein
VRGDEGCVDGVQAAVGEGGVSEEERGKMDKSVCMEWDIGHTRGCRPNESASAGWWLCQTAK